MLHLQLNMRTEINKFADYKYLHNANQWLEGYLEVSVVDSGTSQ